MLSHFLRAATPKEAAEITFISVSSNRASGTSVTVTAPTGIQDGDLLVAISVTGTTARTLTPPSGFTVYSTQGGTNNTICVSSKVASSESGDYTFTWNISDGNRTTILVYRNASAVDTIGTAGKTTSATVTAPSISPSTSGVLIAHFSIEAGTSISTPPSEMTSRYTSSTGPSTGVYDLAIDSGATGDKTLVFGTSNQNCGLLVKIG